MAAKLSTPSHREAWFASHTDDHFARLIQDLDELDEPVPAVLRGALQPGETCLLIIRVPYQGALAAREHKQLWFKSLPWEFTPDWVLALTNNRLLLVRLAETGNAPQVIPIPLENILSLQNGTVLLFSWFEVCWAENGAIRRQKVYYNAVSERLFTRLTAIVRASWPAVGENEGGPCSLDKLPFKFKNLLPLRVFLPDEQAYRVLFRPSLWQTHHGLFRHMTAPRMALALTVSCLALAEEDLTGRDGSYGFIVTCLPRAAVRKIESVADVRKPALRISLARQGANLDLCTAFPPQSADALLAWVS